MHREDTMRYTETLLNIKSATLDRSNEVEVKEFNNLLDYYRRLIMLEDTKITDSAGKTITTDEVMTEKFAFKPGDKIQVQVGKRISDKEVIPLTNIKDLFGKLKPQAKA